MKSSITRAIAAVIFAALLAACAPAGDKPAATEQTAAAEQTAATERTPATGPLGSPASFRGTLPCADCPGIETTLSLRADGVYVLRERYLGKPDGEFNPALDIGRYTLDATADRLVLRGGREAPLFYRPQADGGLRKLALDGAEIESDLPYDLARLPEFVTIDDPARLVGEYRTDAGRSLFRECVTGLELPIADGTAAAELATAASVPHPEATALMAIVAGHIGADAQGQDVLVVDRFERVEPGPGCAVAAGAAGGVSGAGAAGGVSGAGVATLEMTTWRATTIDGAPVPAVEGRAGTPEIRLEPADKRVSGTDGCNRLMGVYTLDGEKVSFGPLAGTKMACPPPIMDLASAFTTALTATTRWSITDGALVLSDEERERLRFER